jgi:hypothetical protein
VEGVENLSHSAGLGYPISFDGFDLYFDLIPLFILFQEKDCFRDSTLLNLCIARKVRIVLKVSIGLRTLLFIPGARPKNE